MPRLHVNRLLCFGDSHVRVFEPLEVRKRFFPLKVEVVRTTAATVSGLKNPNSKSGSTKMFNERLAETHSYCMATVCMGEVDTGFVIWWRAEHREIGVEEALLQAIDNYLAFLENFCRFQKTIVISAPLPTIADDAQWGEVANARSEIKASQKDRTELTLRFNCTVEERVRELGLDYLNLDSASLDPSTGLVKPGLLNKEQADHHYDQQAHAELLVKPLLKKLGILRYIPHRLFAKFLPYKKAKLKS